MLLRLLQTLLAGIALVAAIRPRPVQLAVEETHPPAPGITYRQLRHLVVAAILLVFALWLGLWLVARTSEIITLLAISIVLAVALRPTVDRLTHPLPVVHRRMPRALAVLLIYLILAGIAAGIGFLVVPLIVTEVQALIANFPTYVRQLNETLRFLQSYPFVPDLAALQNQLASQLLGSLSQAVAVLLFAANLLGSLFSIGLVLVLTFFLIVDADRIYEHFCSLAPPSRRGHAMEMTAKMGRKIEGWLIGTIFLSVSVGVATSVGMWLLGMPYPLLLGLGAGLFEFLPWIGPYLGAAPAVIAALFQPTWKLIAVILFFIAVQQVENNVLVPAIMGRKVELPPLLVILALLFGAALRGIVGALLAVPVAAVLHVIWLDLVVPEIQRRTVAEGEDSGPRSSRGPGGSATQGRATGSPD